MTLWHIWQLCSDLFLAGDSSSSQHAQQPQFPQLPQSFRPLLSVKRQHMTPSHLQSLPPLPPFEFFDKAAIRIITRMMRARKRRQRRIFKNMMKQLQKESAQSFCRLITVKPKLPQYGHCLWQLWGGRSLKSERSSGLYPTKRFSSSPSFFPSSK